MLARAIAQGSPLWAQQHPVVCGHAHNGVQFHPKTPALLRVPGQHCRVFRELHAANVFNVVCQLFKLATDLPLHVAVASEAMQCQCGLDCMGCSARLTRWAGVVPCGLGFFRSAGDAGGDAGPGAASALGTALEGCAATCAAVAGRAAAAMESANPGSTGSPMATSGQKLNRGQVYV